MSNLMHTSKKGAHALLYGQLIRLFCQVVSMVVLARLLSPEDYGLTAIAFAIISIGEIFRDFGLSTAAIQAPLITHEEKTNLFWANALIGLIFAILLYTFGWIIADVYKDKRLELICQILSITFLINGCSTQFRADLNRDLKFKSLAVIDTVAAFTSTSVAILLATNDFSYWSIVFQQMTNYFIALILLIYASNWTPGFPHPKVSIKKFTDYGGSLFGMQLIGQLSKSIDTFVIGYQFGSQWLGIYNRAQQIVSTPLSQINQPTTTLALPILSKLNNNDGEYYRFLHHGQSILLNVVCLLFSILAINAEIVVSIALGDKWLSAVPFVQILCIGAIFQVACYPDYWICLSKALIKERLKFTIYTRPIIILMVVLGGLGNIYTVTISYIAGFLFIWIYSYYFLRKLGIQNKELFKNSLVVCFTYIGANLLLIYLTHIINLSGIYKHIFPNILFFIYLTTAFFLSNTYKQSLFSLLKLKK